MRNSASIEVNPMEGKSNQLPTMRLFEPKPKAFKWPLILPLFIFGFHTTS
jgi:hypothetical protein